MIDKVMVYLDIIENGNTLSSESNNVFDILYKAGYKDALYHIRTFLEEMEKIKDHHSQDDDDVSNTEGITNEQRTNN